MTATDTSTGDDGTDTVILTLETPYPRRGAKESSPCAFHRRPGGRAASLVDYTYRRDGAADCKRRRQAQPGWPCFASSTRRPGGGPIRMMHMPDYDPLNPDTIADEAHQIADLIRAWPDQLLEFVDAEPRPTSDEVLCALDTTRALIGSNNLRNYIERNWTPAHSKRLFQQIDFIVVRAERCAGSFDTLAWSPQFRETFVRVHWRVFLYVASITAGRIHQWGEDIRRSKEARAKPKYEHVESGGITLTEAAEKHDVPMSAWSKAANKAPDKPGFLPTRRVGRNRFVTREHAKRFADDYEARREQRAVGTKRKRPG